MRQHTPSGVARNAVRRPQLFALLAPCALLLSGAAQAELYCVGTSTELVNALVNSRGGGASEIRIRTGSYNVVGGPFAALNVVDASDLSMSGGWNAGCTSVTATSPDQTLLNANATGRLLEVNFPQGASNRVSFAYLRFQGGQSATPDAGCVNVVSAASNSASVYFDLNSFRLCNSGSGGSALKTNVVNTLIYLRGNLFVDNSSSDGALQLKSTGNSAFFVTNNTIANNAAPDGSGGINFIGTANDIFDVSNNVVWANGPSASRLDLSFVGTVNGTFANNLVGASSVIPATLVNTGTLTSDPRFVNVIDPRPTATSPMRNSGINSPPGGTTGIDFDFAPRQAGPRVDRGAFEFREVFANGFE